MIQLSDFHVGQAVVVVENQRRGNVYHTTVAKIGRKYITIAGSWGQQFYVSDPKAPYLVEKSIYGAASLLYPSEDAYQQAVEKSALEKQIRNAMDWPYISRYTLDQLRRIKAIIDEGEGETT